MQESTHRVGTINIYNSDNVGFEVLTAVVMKSCIF
jgi:hypothetical protein